MPAAAVGSGEGGGRAGERYDRAARELGILGEGALTGDRREAQQRAV